MKWKHILLLATFLSALFLGLMQFDDPKEIINKYIKDSLVLQALPYLFVLGTTAANTWITYIDPARRLEKAEKAKNIQLLHTAHRLITGFDFPIKFNVMTIKRSKYFLFLDPLKNGKGILLPFPRFFKSAWTAPENHKIPDNFKLGIRQGSSGKAREITPENAALTTSGVDLPMYSFVDKDYSYAFEKLNLNRKQYRQCEPVKFLFSVPIYIREQGDSEPKFIGIFTLESTSEALAKLVTADIDKITDIALKQYSMDTREDIMDIVREMKDEYIRLYF